MPLRFPPFAASDEMQAASRNQHAFHLHSAGRGVALMQGGLIQAGYPMPRSLRLGLPDGFFGSETLATVKAFQQKQKLLPDGVAGKDTINSLDDLLFNASTPAPPAPPPPLPPRTREYQLGTSDPPRGHDPGAGIWNSRPTEATSVALKASIISALPGAYIIVGDDATKHMAHYFLNSGLDYTIDLEGMVAEVPSAKERYEDE